MIDTAFSTEYLASLAQQDATDVIRWALETLGRDRVAISTSFQLEGMAVLDMAWRINPRVRAFTIDTGRLPQETYDMIDRVRERYGIEVEVFMPAAEDVEQFTSSFGANAFYRSVDFRLSCCEIRKVRPLRRALQGLDGWFTGLRRGQADSRTFTPKVEIDEEHGGILKINPLADWTEDDVREYVRSHDVPVHALYAQGYQSIGCAPCSRPVAPGESARAGRWWWEAQDVPKECGIHFVNGQVVHGYAPEPPEVALAH